MDPVSPLSNSGGSGRLGARSGAPLLQVWETPLAAALLPSSLAFFIAADLRCCSRFRLTNAVKNASCLTDEIFGTRGVGRGRARGRGGLGIGDNPVGLLQAAPSVTDILGEKRYCTLIVGIPQVPNMLAKYFGRLIGYY